MGAKQIEQAQLALDRRDRQDARCDELLERTGLVIERWEILSQRVARVLDGLERGDPT